MARRRSGGGSASGAGKTKAPSWLERLERQPVGAVGVGVVVVGWLVLALVYFRAAWSLEVTFFVAVGLLTFVLGCLSLFAAAAEARRAKPTAVLRLPEWLKDFEDYFRWLTPFAFMFGLISAHYFWHWTMDCIPPHPSRPANT
jgi:hypothetical protein